MSEIMVNWHVGVFLIPYTRELMKNNDLQELKPVYIHEASYTENNDINLVDLAIILLRRKKMIAAIIMIAIAFGVATALLKPRTYTVNTTIEIGRHFFGDTINYFETPQTLLAKLQYSYIPQIMNSHGSANPNDTAKYEIIAHTPTGSTLVILESDGTEKQNASIKVLLTKAAEIVIQDHSQIHELIKQNIITSRAQVISELTSLKSEKNAPIEKIKLFEEKIEAYNSQLTNLRNTRIISDPTTSLEPTGGSRKLIVIITTFTGILFAVFSAFFAEFSIKVREANLQSPSDR